jgi:hypothetical protein
MKRWFIAIMLFVPIVVGVMPHITPVEALPNNANYICFTVKATITNSEAYERELVARIVSDVNGNTIQNIFADTIIVGAGETYQVDTADYFNFRSSTGSYEAELYLENPKTSFAHDFQAKPCEPHTYCYTFTVYSVGTPSVPLFVNIMPLPLVVPFGEDPVIYRKRLADDVSMVSFPLTDQGYFEGLERVKYGAFIDGDPNPDVFDFTYGECQPEINLNSPTIAPLLNEDDPAAPAAIFAPPDLEALHIYAVDPVTAQGVLSFVVTYEEIQSIHAQALEQGENLLVRESEDERHSLYVLSTGMCQLNSWQLDGKLYEFIFECPE